LIFTLIKSDLNQHLAAVEIRILTSWL